MAELDRLFTGLLGEKSGSDDGKLLGSLMGALGSGGGQSLPGLVQQLQEGGIGEQARSWIGAGGNKSVSGPQIAQALPYQTLDHAARQSGMTPESAADRIAQVLPTAVDRLTPGGQVPQGSLEDALRHRL